MDRDTKSLMRKFDSLVHTKAPIGDPYCPSNVLRTKQIRVKIKNTLDYSSGRSGKSDFDSSTDNDDDSNDDDDICEPIIESASSISTTAQSASASTTESIAVSCSVSTAPTTATTTAKTSTTALNSTPKKCPLL